MTTIREMLAMSQAEHSRLRALHGQDFPALIEPWLGLLEMMALARGHGADITRVVLGLIGDASAQGQLDRPHVGLILAAFEERCEQDRIGTVMLFEAQSGSHHGVTESTE